MVGRLDYAKGIDLFLVDMVKIINKRPHTHLYIIGDGSERNRLESQCHKLRLTDHVTFLGAQKNPYKYMARMDGLVLNSRYEGQGIVLMEASVLGLQLFFPKRLEKYNPGLSGSRNIISDITKARSRPHKLNHLNDYNHHIVRQLDHLFDNQKFPSN